MILFVTWGSRFLVWTIAILLSSSLYFACVVSVLSDEDSR